jgi:hypothetical protein
MCRAEMDRLLEQSPIIPMNLLSDFDSNPKFDNITKPDVLKITEIREYKPSKDERVQNIVSGATEQFKNFYLQPSQDPANSDQLNKQHINAVPHINNIINKSKENVNKRFEDKKNELSELGGNKLVSNLFKNNRFVNSLPTDSFSKSYIDIKKDQAKELNNVLPLIKSNLEEKAETLKNNAQNAIDETIEKAVNNTTNKIDNFIETQKSDIENNIVEVQNNAQEIKKNITIKVDNIKNEVNNRINDVNNTINDINENIDNIENTGPDKI